MICRGARCGSHLNRCEMWLARGVRCTDLQNCGPRRGRRIFRSWGSGRGSLRRPVVQRVQFVVRVAEERYMSHSVIISRPRRHIEIHRNATSCMSVRIRRLAKNSNRQVCPTCCRAEVALDPAETLKSYVNLVLSQQLQSTLTRGGGVRGRVRFSRTAEMQCVASNSSLTPWRVTVEGLRWPERISRPNREDPRAATYGGLAANAQPTAGRLKLRI